MLVCLSTGLRCSLKRSLSSRLVSPICIVCDSVKVSCDFTITE